MKFLDVLTSLPVSHTVLPRDLCFATSRPANHAICSFIDLSGYAFGPIRRCLFVDYIINSFIDVCPANKKNSHNIDLAEYCPQTGTEMEIKDFKCIFCS